MTSPPDDCMKLVTTSSRFGAITRTSNQRYTGVRNRNCWLRRKAASGAARRSVATSATGPALVIEHPEVRGVEAALYRVSRCDAPLAVRRHECDQLPTGAVEQDLKIGADEEHVLHLRRDCDAVGGIAV